MDHTHAIHLFEQYDFHNDNNFLAGWDVIAGQIEPTKRELAFIQAKIFYFNKCVARLELDEYISWFKNKKTLLEPVSDQTPSLKDSVNTCLTEKTQMKAVSSALTYSCLKEFIQVENKAELVSKQEHNIDYVKDSISETEIQSYTNENSSMRNDKIDEECQLSFSQVADLILNNQVIPGVKNVNVQPTNGTPTPSLMNRRPKPWEINTNV
ncbi:hypothetical protein Bpfe_000884 [Biomphalaria pfeifferi]|uniref:Uncharacterized protein n=1 Tax=Biomphalaria pfeifferi TaxID=112525 RepID=A0AAD8FLT4_BIOPF|nr:hypothetical protein Bpfe_000884 [Biomphalaria pfeifferi]